MIDRTFGFTSERTIKDVVGFGMCEVKERGQKCSPLWSLQGASF